MQRSFSMAIKIDDAKFLQIVDICAGNHRISSCEIQAIVYLLQLAASVDLDEEPEEDTLLQALTSRLCARGGLAMDRIPPLSPIPTDAEERAAWIAMLAHQLVTSAARDLGYALAYLVIVVDLELAPIESTLLEQLRLAFSIPRARADDLTEAVARIVTPGEAPAPDLDVVAGER